MQYYLSKGAGEVNGPFESTVVRTMLAAGEIDGNTQTCPEGSQTWQPLSSIAEFAGVGVAPASPAAPPPTTGDLAQARMSLVGPILVTVFCCVIGGVVSIVYASHANTAAAGGNLAAALKARKTAQIWMWVTFALGFAMTGLYLLMIIAGAVSGY